MKHVVYSNFSNFLNKIHIRQPTQIEINNVILCCYISNFDISSHMDCNIMILCSHKKDLSNESLILSKWTLQHKYTYEAYYYKA